MPKNNEEYWQERFIQLLDAQNKKADKSIAELKKLFQRTSRELQKDIAYWYQRFAADNALSMAQARHILKAKELAEFRWTVKEYINAAKSAGDEPLAQQLQNASTRLHVTRLEALLMQLRQRTDEVLGQQTIDGIKDAIRETYSDTYYRTAYELQKGTGTVFDVAALDEKQLDLILSKPWMPDGSNFSDRIWRNKSQLLDNLQRELMQGVIKGEAQPKIVERMTKRMDAAASNIGRLVATESAHFATQAEHDSMQELGVEEYRVLATLDNVTSDICRGMDGQVFKMSEYKPGTTAPPFHPWCRSCTVPNVPRGGLRAARIGEGKTYHVDGKMNYEQWKGTYLVERSSKMANEGGINVWPKDALRITPEQYKEIQQVAKENNLLLEGVRNAKGDHELIKDYLREVGSIAKEYPLPGGKITVSLSDGMAPEEFAESSGKKRKITFNSKALYNKEATAKNYDKAVQSGFFTKGTDYRHIAYHEYGHLLVEAYHIDQEKIFKVVSGIEPKTQQAEIFLAAELSKYSQDLVAKSSRIDVNIENLPRNSKKFNEILSECLSSIKGTSPTDFALRFIAECDKIMKKQQRRAHK